MVERGELVVRWLLSGELEASQGEEIKVPRTPSWQVAIRWQAEDGAEVAAGQKVLELDNSQFVAELEDKRLAAAQQADELARKQVQLALEEAEKAFEVERRQAELAKAGYAAAVPEFLLSRREHQERQLAAERARLELAKAQASLAAHREAAAAELAVQEVALTKARREIATAEAAIAALTVTAPAGGFLEVAEHPWEGRKFQVGDTAWAGLTVLRIPDLASMVVRATLWDVDDGRIQPGMAASCVLDSYPDRAYGCRVEEITPMAREPSYDSLRRYFQVRLALDEVDPARMRPGMSVRVEVETARLGDALLVPRAALDWSGAEPRVRLADGGAVAVQLGPCGARSCAVAAGLAEGDRLVANGGER